MKAELAAVVAEFAKATNERFEAIEAVNASLVSDNASLKAELNNLKQGDKFGATPKKTGSETVSYKTLLKK